MRSMDVSNGENLGVSLFVQGCPEPHCKNCFNPETWNFNGGKEWTEDAKNEFVKLIDKQYIKRISILGGEPLASQNLEGVLDLITTIYVETNSSQEKTIWIYSGYVWEDIFSDTKIQIDDYTAKINEDYEKRQQIIKLCNVFVDGRYIDSQRDISLKWRGSKNQRVINVQESLKQGKVILYCE